MQHDQGFVTRYRLRWMLLVAIFLAAVMILVFTLPMEPVKLEEVKSVVKKENPPSQNIAESTANMIIDMEELEIALSSSEGDLKVRFWAEKALKKEQEYKVNQGVLQFALEDKNTLLVRVEEALYFAEEDSGHVTGKLIGNIPETGQFFKATDLEWQVDSNILKAKTVTYGSPGMEIQGELMLINMQTGEITFEGSVEAGV